MGTRLSWSASAIATAYRMNWRIKSDRPCDLSKVTRG